MQTGSNAMEEHEAWGMRHEVKMHEKVDFKGLSFVCATEKN
jgi:hypothetical protein